MVRSFRTALFRLALLGACVLVGDRALGALFDAQLTKSQFRFSVAARGGLPPILLVLGDSRGVNGLYAPELEKRTGTRVLNLAYNGMSTLVAEAVLRDYLERNDKPRGLVLEVTNVQDNHQLLDGLMCYWRFGPALSALADERSSVNRRAARAFHLYAYNGEIPMRALFYAKVLSPNYNTNFFLIGWTPGTNDSHNVFLNLYGCRDDHETPHRGRPGLRHVALGAVLVNLLADAP